MKKFLSSLKIGVLLLLGTVSYASICQSSDPTRNEVASELGWIAAKETPTNLCGGFYVEPQLSAFGLPIAPSNQSKTSFTFDRAIYNQDQPSILSGHVVVIQSGRRIEADEAILVRDPKTGKLLSIDLIGHVKMYEPGRLVLANKVHLNVANQTGILNDVIYRFLLAQDPVIPSLEQPFGADGEESFSGLTAWGLAQTAQQLKPGNTVYQTATYTTCAPTVEQWRLHAKKLHLDKAKGRGVARDVVITVRDFPVFYTPYLSFPLNKNRKTGFLYPTFGYGNISGLSLAWPFYWNIAPNYDATITPRYYSDRGLLTNGLFRYLTSSSNGDLQLGFIPNDKEFKTFQETAQQYSTQFGYDDLLDDSDNRGMFSWQNNTVFDQHWNSNINFSQVSDDYYLQDFGDLPSEISTNQLLRQGDINYTGTNWNFSGILENYQTLNPVNRQPIATLYSRLPELDLNANYPNLWGGLDFSIANQIVYFTREMGPTDTTTPPSGERLDIMPGLSWPIRRMSGFFVPSVNLVETDYNLANQTPGDPDGINRTLPIVDVDSGLYFDRDISLFGKGYDQTLEPRVYYLYAPYENQDDIPVFDSALVPFNYSALFLDNRFSGDDRIGDANQVSVGVTSRLLDDATGAEKFHFSIGQIYYFENRQVTLCTQPGCTDVLTGLGVNSNTEKVSPFASQMTYYLTPFWSANGDVAWDPGDKQFDTGDYYLQYEPNQNVLFNFGYNFLLNGNIIDTVPAGSSENNLNLITTSMAVPLTYHWSTLGEYSFNISQRQTQSYLAGVQYENCCYALRVVGGRTFTALNQDGQPTYNTGVYVQWELKGLANFDPMNTSSLLVSEIPGYHDPFAASSSL